MNDPGLDDAIADEPVALDEASTNPKERRGPEGKLSSQYPQAARWWLASTAYPLMAVCQTWQHAPNIFRHPISDVLLLLGYIWSHG